MRVQEVIDAVNSNKYWSIYDFEEEFCLKAVERDLHIERDRWFEVSTVVYRCEDGYVGVSGVTTLYSEMMSWDDCYCPCIAKEYRPVQTITYEPVK